MNYDQSQETVRKMLMAMQAFQQQNHSMIRDFDHKVSASLAEQRRNITDFVRTDIKKELDNSLRNYRQACDEAGHSLGKKVHELEKHLDTVVRQNKQLVFKLWLAALSGVIFLVIGGSALSYYYFQTVSKNRMDAKFVEAINQSSMTLCPDGKHVCASVGSEKYGQYRVVKQK